MGVYRPNAKAETTAGSGKPSRVIMEGYHRGQQVDPSALTEREKQVLLALMAGAISYKDLAERLGIRWRTVRNHIYNIGQKTGCGGMIALIQWGRRNGYNEQ